MQTYRRIYRRALTHTHIHTCVVSLKHISSFCLSLTHTERAGRQREKAKKVGQETKSTWDAGRLATAIKETGCEKDRWQLKTQEDVVVTVVQTVSPWQFALTNTTVKCAAPVSPQLVSFPAHLLWLINHALYSKQSTTPQYLSYPPCFSTLPHVPWSCILFIPLLFISWTPTHSFYPVTCKYFY